MNIKIRDDYGFCTKCGGELIAGYIVSTNSSYSKSNGRKLEHRYWGLVCEKIHRRVFDVTWPYGWNTDAENPTGHDAFPIAKKYYYWGKVVPDYNLYSSLPLVKTYV